MSPTYNTWSSMRRRCSKESNHNYAEYGGRGIGYDEKWDTFAGFLEDMGVRPEGKTLDRMDPDGHYDKDNCRWATPTEQVNNLRTNHVVTIGPFSLSVSEWADLLGIGRAMIYRRLAVGWNPVKAVCIPGKLGRRLASDLASYRFPL
ncbi:hypothetical protein GNX71_18470 [Variovorax sp. RKNM96]|uniref:hypothetical protein n=1 Tax=Variovorax sp. RKNM96 TaxID=2681552 RepID=UPI001981A1CF|nr:hypothetical protein [Variovorax sp. RKNM96]QSI31455.1 hypothetical protein GNX71_18470 [Variovorax sp. RKNM96]